MDDTIFLLLTFMQLFVQLYVSVGCEEKKEDTILLCLFTFGIRHKISRLPRVVSNASLHMS